MADETRVDREQLVRIMASLIYAAELHANMVNKSARRDPDVEACLERAKHLLAAPLSLPPKPA